MVDKRFVVPLSPPNSPRMTDYAKSSEDHDQHASKMHAHSERRSHREDSNVSLGSHEDVGAYSRDLSESSLRPYSKNFAYSSALVDGSYEPHSSDAFSSNASGYGQQPRHFRPSDLQPTTTYGGSLPTSPDGRLTPRSPDNSVQGQQNDDDLIDSAGEDQDEGVEKVQMTAAELRAHKRKMKRFRLTHSQTRFLMSEFARQAHPDAGHRERLAREIPGLSARQVQVWFQNRRAKLKRHTTDDQARMMRSRAMPEDFDTTQALHSPFGAQQPHMGGLFPSNGTYSTYGEPGGVRALTLNTPRGIPEYDQYAQSYASCSGVSPALGAFAFTPPHPEPDHISPVPSATITPYVMEHQAAYHSTRRGPIGLPAFDQRSAPIHHTQRLPLHEGLSRTYGDSNSPPIRTSISHPGLATLGGRHHQLPERATSFSDHASYNHQHARPPRGVGVTESNSYGVELSYNPLPSYPSNEPPHQRLTTEPEQFRGAPSELAYCQYPPMNCTSAPHQNYQPSYTSREIYSNYPQQGQAEPASHVPRDHSHLHGEYRYSHIHS